jgi:polyhydroxyalkanoate synthesis regulator phasin
MLLSITVNRIDESFKKEAENAEKQLQQRMEQINAVKDLEKEKKSYDDMIEEYEKTGIVTKELQSTYESLRVKLEEQGITVSTSGDAFKNCQTAVEDFSEKVKSAGTAALAAATARKKDDAEKGVLGQLVAKITGNTALSKFSGLNLGATTRKALQKRGATLASSTTFQSGVSNATDIQGDYDYEQFKRINDTLVNGGPLVSSEDRAELQTIMDEYAEQTQIYKEKLIEDTNNILKEQSHNIENSIDGIERSFDKIKQTAVEKNLGLSEEALREKYFEILRKNKRLN